MMKKIGILAITLFTMGAFAQTLTDGQISKALLTMNESEIDAAELAKDKAKNAEIKQFAVKMEEHHEASVKDTKKVAKDNDIKAKDSDLSKSLKAEAKTSKVDLKRGLDRGNFDKTYIQQQVVMHEKALKTLDETLIPAAANPNFKAHLQQTRAAVATHLEEAKALNSKLQ